MSTSKKTSKKMFLLVCLLTIIMALTGCGSDPNSLDGNYLSEDGKTRLVCDDTVIFLIQDEEINVSEYKLTGNTLTLGETNFQFSRASDGESIKIGSEVYEESSLPFSVRWDLIKWSSNYRIKHTKLGVIQWMILDPIFMSGVNSVGHYALVGSWMAFIGLIIFIIVLYFVISILRERASKK